MCVCVTLFAAARGRNETSEKHATLRHVQIDCKFARIEHSTTQHKGAAGALLQARHDNILVVVVLVVRRVRNGAQPQSSVGSVG